MMTKRDEEGSRFGWQDLMEIGLLVLLMFTYAGEPPPMVNEAHYLVKAKNFWDAGWCNGDLFATSGKAHTTYYLVFGWLTKFFSMDTTTWIARVIGWLGLAIGLQRLSFGMIGRRYASLAVLVIWAVGIDQLNLAGEWVIGGTEAKIPAYGFVLMGINAMTARRWNACWIWFGLASAFHVLVGGWAVIAAAIVWVAVEIVARTPAQRRARFFTWGLFLGGALSLIGLIPAIMLTSQATNQESITAARTYVYLRLAHHLLPSSFPGIWFVRHGLLIVGSFASVWAVQRTSRPSPASPWSSLRLFTACTVVVALIGLAIDFLPIFDRGTVAQLLRYYWFRMTDVTVPLLLGLTIAAGISVGRPTVRTSCMIVFMGFGLVFVSSSIQRMRLLVPPAASNRLLGWDASAPPKRQQQVFQDWLKACDFIRNTTPPDEVFLTPRHQQTFKWYAHRAEVVNFKDVPQDATSLLEWSKRFADVFPQRLGTMRVTIDYATLRGYRERFGVRYMLVDRRIAGHNLPLIRVYPTEPEQNATYAIYELPPPLPQRATAESARDE